MRSTRIARHGWCLLFFACQTALGQLAAHKDSLSITPRAFFLLLGEGLKDGVTKPFHTAQNEWWQTAKFVGVVGALSFADEPIQKFSLGLRNKNKGLRNVSRYVTNTGGLYEICGLTGLALYGWVFKKNQMKTTTLLAGQAYIVSGAFESVLKLLTGRQRPIVVDSVHLEAEPTFHGPFYKFPPDNNGKKTNGSFPSGHTTVAFAAATVFATEYKDRPLVVASAYSIATLISLSRITENKHWFTDVLTGATLGYLTGKLVVNNYHRYIENKNNKGQGKGQLMFTLQCVQRRPMLGLVYQFE
jgi:membrane-associated phospholipid phosphatase